MSTKKKIAIIITVTLVVVTLSLTGLCIYSVNTFANSDMIASNITYNGVYIGDLTKEEALIVLKNYNFNINNPVTIAYNDKTFEVAPSAAGLNYDYDKIVDTAYSFGRRGNFFSSLKDIISSRVKYNPIEIEYIYDSDTFIKTIDTVSRTSGIDFNNFEIDIYENYAKVKINKELTNIDYNKLYTDIVTAVEENNKRSINLPTLKVDKVTPQMIYNRIYVKPQNASSEVKDGITIVTPHTIGVIVELSDIEKALEAGKTSFTVPIVKKYPEVRVENLSGELFSDVLGSYTSKYNSSLIGRTRNVTLAANKINGVILNSGDIFSYNNIVGPRTARTGFSVATVYTKEGLEEEMGGGICQVSSSLYNAVLYADLKIVERKNHMYTVAYVRNGLDATVAYGLIDFKFQNNLKSPVKVVTSVGGGVLTVTLLGKKENQNKVELYTNTLESYPFDQKEVENPELAPGEKVITQNGGLGYKINATKVVKDSSGNILRQEFLGTNVYKPLTQITEIGPVLSETPVTEENVSEEIIPPSQPGIEEVIPETPAEEITKPSEDETVTESETSSEDTQAEEDTSSKENDNLPLEEETSQGESSEGSSDSL